MISIESLIEAGSIHPFKATPQEIQKALNLARRDINEAEKIQASSLDWCFTIAYNCVLQACRAYMFQLGYRSASSESHKTTFQFMKIVASEEMKQSIDYFDRVRIKRHRALYDEPGLVSEKEAQKLLDKAREFLGYTIEFIASDGNLKNGLNENQQS